MPTPVETYFEAIATLAATAVQDQDAPPVPLPPVFDAPQEARATAWTGISVHPMSVLESEYVALVQAAERAQLPDQDRAREAGFAELSRFFSMTSDAPPLLMPDAPPLIEERAKDLAARLTLVKAMLDENVAGVLDELAGLVADAAEMIALMTNANELAHAGQGLRDAAAYLGMFAETAPQAAATWARRSGDANRVADYLAEVTEDLVTPLLAPANAAASPRSLFNIAPFYLYRLMHRFVGGDQAAPMDLASKGIASGAATAAMHRRDWPWLTAWHEEQVVKLQTALQALDGRLRGIFGLNEEVIRFHLKGGRAMFTALGTPDLGSNDWDTGVLINPALTPDQWYDAFSQVSDLVVSFLDQARFGYTALLNAHADVLNTPPLQAAARPAPADLSERKFSRLALLADHHADTTMRATPRRALVARTAVGAALAAQARVLPIGVNGELIDIGISRRNSVELAEHWQAVQIQTKPGVAGVAIPVPTLPYFIDDFSTILREALATGTAGRKLAKRIYRLKLVLESDDATLVGAVTAANRDARAALPQGAAAFGTGLGDAAARLRGWVLAEVLQSLPDGRVWPGWLDVLDQWLAAQAATLLDPAGIAVIWQQIAPALDANDRAVCESVLVAESAAGVLAGQIVADAKILARAVGGPDLADAPLWQGVQGAIASVMALNTSATAGRFYLTGGLAARMQTAHAGVATDDLLADCPDGPVELFYRTGNLPADRAFAQLVQRFGQVLGRFDLAAQLVSADGQPVVVVTAIRPVRGLVLGGATPAVMVVRTEPPGAGTARILDTLEGWLTASARDLTRLFAERAAGTPDFALRNGRRATAEFLRSDLLGRQLR